jgi:hypothetical protein
MGLESPWAIRIVGLGRFRDERHSVPHRTTRLLAAATITSYRDRRVADRHTDELTGGQSE